MEPNFPNFVFAFLVVAFNCHFLGGGTDLYTVRLVYRLHLLGYLQLVPVADRELPVGRNLDDRVVLISCFLETLIL